MRPETERLHTERVQHAIGKLAEGESPSALAEQADEAAFSRFHYQRVFKQIMGETPGDLRRRLLLERAAWQLRSGKTSVTEIAFDAEFQSLEGFIRAFGKAFAISPSRYRKAGQTGYRLPCENGIHYTSVAGYLPLSLSPRGTKMDMTDRLLEHDLWLVRQILERAKSLSDEELDSLLHAPSQITSFESEEKTLRALLDRLVFGKEVWVAALEHQDFPDKDRDKSVEGMLRRFEIAYPTFVALAKRVRDQNKWDETFVDELCEPPETFTFGGMIAHVITFGIFRRQKALEALRILGIEDLSYGDPIEWERSLTT